MPRRLEALNIEPWAASGDRSTPADLVTPFDRDEGWPASYSQVGGKLPSREVFNQVLFEFSSMLDEINRHGLLVWDSSLEYFHPCLVVDDGTGQVYRSVEPTGYDATDIDGTGSLGTNVSLTNTATWILYANAGWSPQIAIDTTTVTGQVLLKLTGWTGGQGMPPNDAGASGASTYWLGMNGFVTNSANAAEITGPVGPRGPQGQFAYDLYQSAAIAPAGHPPANVNLSTLSIVDGPTPDPWTRELDSVLPVTSPNQIWVSRAMLNPAAVNASGILNGVTFSEPFELSPSVRGATGNAGDDGDDGDDGERGLRGFSGSAGDAGATGAQGATGPRGFTGNQGSPGIQGPPGSGVYRVYWPTRAAG